MKKGHQYIIRIEHTQNSDGSTPDDQPVEFGFVSHDEIFAILEKLKQRPDIGPETAQQLGLGIKLLVVFSWNIETRHCFQPLRPISPTL